LSVRTGPHSHVLPPTKVKISSGGPMSSQLIPLYTADRHIQEKTIFSSGINTAQGIYFYP